MLPVLVEHIHLVVDCIVSDCSSSSSSSGSSNSSSSSSDDGIDST